MSEPKNKKKSRSGHKSYLTHALNKVDECVANYTPQRKDELAQWKESLQEQLQKVTTLSDQILALMEAHEELTDDLSTEFMDTNRLKCDVTMRLSAMLRTSNVDVTMRLSAMLRTLRMYHHRCLAPPQICTLIKLHLIHSRSRRLLQFERNCPSSRYGSLGETSANGRSFGTPSKALSTETRHWPK